MKNKKGFTLVEVCVSWIIITIIILNASVFFLFAWKLKTQYEDDRAVLEALTNFIEAKKATCIGSAPDRSKITDYGFNFTGREEFGVWKTFYIDLWDYKEIEKKNLYPPLIYPLPHTREFRDDKPDIEKDDKFVEIKYRWCQIEISRDESDPSRDPNRFLMPSLYVWCKAQRSERTIGMQVTNSFPWRNYNDGSSSNF